MKFTTRIFVLALLFAPLGAWAATPLVGTAGNNLTAFNSGMGAINNNTWNQLTNSRTAPAADFGNCNSLILRCAQPKCASGGCISMDIAYPIVSGCVMANDSCKKHGDALIQTIAAQMVAASTAKANEQAAAAQAAAAAQTAQQSEAQYQQMQQQMQQMQAQMSQQNAQQVAQLQQALEEQKQIAQAAANEAAAREAAARTAAVESTVANSTIEAAEKGVSADVLAREQASGQILTQLENAQVALNALQKTMQNTFDYAGCDRNGNNCTGPKRVKVFKQKAGEFFDPYETVLDEVYDALIMAQSLGVDITDIYMMLNGSCNVWGKYLCINDQTMHYTGGASGTCGSDGRSVPQKGTSVIGGAKCTVGQVVPMSDGGCQLIQMLNNNEEVQQNWLYPEDGAESKVRVGCASEALDNSVLFRGRKKQASIDIETLQRIIDQDSPTRISQAETDRYGANAITRFCSVDDDDIYKLQVLAQKKTLTTTGSGFRNICVEDRGSNLAPRAVSGALTITAKSCEELNKFEAEGDIIESDESRNIRETRIADCRKERENNRIRCNKSYGKWDESQQKCVSCQSETQEVVGNECVDIGKRTTSLNSIKDNCTSSDGTWNKDGYCDCPSWANSMTMDGRCNKAGQTLSTFTFGR